MQQVWWRDLPEINKLVKEIEIYNYAFYSFQLIILQYVLYPLVVIWNFSIHSVPSLSSTANSPADHSSLVPFSSLHSAQLKLLL